MHKYSKYAKYAKYVHKYAIKDANKYEIKYAEKYTTNDKYAIILSNMQNM